jgi:hypothetical protein
MNSLQNEEIILKIDIFCNRKLFCYLDYIIENFDRHLNNWGFLKKEGALRFAPIYDCGSTLSPLISEQKMKEMLSNYIEFKEKEFNVFSCYTMDGKRIFYHEIFKKPPKELISAIKRTVPKINMQKIHDIVNNTEGVSSVRKEYLTKALDMRYEKILAPALKRVLKGELNSNKKEIDKEPLSGSEWDKMINENMKKSGTDQSQGLQNISYDKQMKVHSDEGKGR